MKKLLLFLLLFLTSYVAFCQVSNDSLAYQLQRKKINSMLASRSQKFGQYDQSLSMHTGIFGFQTKKDIRRSNDILMDIVKTDDNIYRELKILLEYRTFQQTQVINHSKETEASTIGYMNTINRLRTQIDRLKADADKQQQEHQKTRNNFIIALIVLAAIVLYLLSRKTKRSV